MLEMWHVCNTRDTVARTTMYMLTTTLVLAFKQFTLSSFSDCPCYTLNLCTCKPSSPEPSLSAILCFSTTRASLCSGIKHEIISPSLLCRALPGLYQG